MTTPTPSSTAKSPARAQEAGQGGGWTFRAPRWGDLVVCPYCDPDTFNCDQCGGERRLFLSEVFQ